MFVQCPGGQPQCARCSDDLSVVFAGSRPQGLKPISFHTPYAALKGRSSTE